MESITYNNTIALNVQKAEPVKIFKNFGSKSQSYKRHRSNDEDTTSTASASSISPTDEMTFNPLALTGAFQSFPSPRTFQRIGPFDNFTTSTPTNAAANAAAVAAAAAKDENGTPISLTISIFKAALGYNGINHQPNEMLLQTPKQIKLEMPSSPSPTPSSYASYESFGELVPSTELKWNLDAMVADIMYNSPRYMELLKAEESNLRKFIEFHKRYFPVHIGGYRQESKVRSVCRAVDASPETGVASPVDIQRKAEFRRINNQNSQLCRHKQKVARIEQGLTAIFLRDRMASYEYRLEKMLDIIMRPVDDANDAEN